MLNRLGHIDAVVTDDSDTLVFGALAIIKRYITYEHQLEIKTDMLFHSSTLQDAGKDSACIVTADAIEHTDAVGLSTGGLLLIALLSGGDYDEKGLEGCGIHIAHGLARYGFGDSLLQAAMSLDDKSLRSFLTTWRNGIRTELSYDSRGLLQRRYNSLAQRIPDTFPSLSVLQLYTHPLTSWSPRFEGNLPRTSHWLPQVVRVHDLTVFCQTYFTWSSADCAKKFNDHLWQGMVVQMFSFVSPRYSFTTYIKI